jgi:hypothetical protein
MPTNRRKRRWNPSGWTDQHIDQLVTGWDFFSEGFGNLSLWEDLSPDVLEQLRACWDEHGDEAMARCQPCRRPWAWWRLAAPESRDFAIHEEEQLHRFGLLSETEIDKARSVRCHAELFRRPWIWWHDHGGRDYEIPEAAQLDRLGAFTERERRIRDERDVHIALNQSSITQAEADYLNLPTRPYGAWRIEHSFMYDH